MDLGKYLRMYLVAIVTAGATAASAWLSTKLGFPVHVSVMVILTPLLLGIKILAHHWHMDWLEAAFEPTAQEFTDAEKPAGSGAGAVAKLLIVAITLGLFLGCSTIDAKTLADFQAKEDAILKKMSTYVAADVAAGKTPVITQATLDAHAAKIKADVRSVDPAEEQAIIAQFQAYLAADPYMVKFPFVLDAWGGELHGHLGLFTSLHR